MHRLRADGEVLEFSHHALIDCPLERHDEGGKALQRLPAPCHEFRLVPARRVLDVNFAFVTE